MRGITRGEVAAVAVVAVVLGATCEPCRSNELVSLTWAAFNFKKEPSPSKRVWEILETECHILLAPMLLKGNANAQIPVKCCSVDQDGRTCFVHRTKDQSRLQH